MYITEDIKDIFQSLLVKKQFMISSRQTFEIHLRPHLFPDFCSNVLYDVPPSHVDKFCLLHSGYSSLSQLVSQLNITIFFNFAYLTQLQTPNTQAKYYEILPAHIETTHDTTHKIANQYFEFEYHFLTLQRKIPIYFEQGCTVIAAHLSSIAFNSLSVNSKVANLGDWSFLNPYWLSVLQLIE